MAVLTPRVVLVCTVSAAVVTLLTIIWSRRSRRTAAPAKSTSATKLPPGSTRETKVVEDDDLCVCSRSEDVSIENAARVSEGFVGVQEHQRTLQVLDLKSNQSVIPTEEALVRLSATEVVKKERSVIINSGSILEDKKSCFELNSCNQDVVSETPASQEQCKIAEELQVMLVEEHSSPDVQIIAGTEAYQEKSSLNAEFVKELQVIMPDINPKFDQSDLTAKLEQDFPLGLPPEEDSLTDVYTSCTSPVNQEELGGDRQVSSEDREESRDSAMGGEDEDLALSESTPTESYSPSRSEFQEELFLPERAVCESAGSECFNDLDEVPESPPHSIYSDEHSEGSCDSGRGGSDIQIISSSEVAGESTLLIYEFELPQDLTGRLIGRFGKHVNSIKSTCNASVLIKRHPFNSRFKLCVLQGTKLEIQNALEMIRKRFPLSQYPAVSLVQVNIPLGCGVIVPETLQLHLPEGVTCDVILSSMVSAGHFFIQQPTHPTYPSLNRLDMCMTSCYTQLDTPQIPHPVEVGVICACPVLEGWFRSQVVNLYEDSEECDVKFVDYGGYSCVPLSRLRQIRSDFMTLPFQASECYLANVTPASESWSSEACATFEELAQGQILQALVVGHADDGIPCVHLYRVQGVSTVFINRELVNRGVAKWLETQA